MLPATGRKTLPFLDGGSRVSAAHGSCEAALPPAPHMAATQHGLVMSCTAGCAPIEPDWPIPCVALHGLEMDRRFTFSTRTPPAGACAPPQLGEQSAEMAPLHLRCVCSQGVHAHRLPAAPHAPGFSPATANHQTVPTGRDALPHLVFLLVLWPLMWALSLAGILLHAPICIAYFAVTGGGLGGLAGLAGLQQGLSRGVEVGSPG